MADYIPDIHALLPQGPPFIMVDRCLACEGPTTRTSFVVRADNPLAWDGRFSVAGLIENIAQTAAAGAGRRAVRDSRSPRTGAVVSISRLEVRVLPRTGEELLTEATVTQEVGDIVVISGRITCRDAIVAEAELKILTGV